MFRYHGKASDLKRALSVVGRVVPKSNTIPILGNVVLEERGGHCCIMGTNLDVSVEVSTDVEDVTGKTTIPHSRLSAFLNVLDDDVVSIEVGKDSGVATCKGGDAVSKIPTLPIEDMPEALFGDLEVPKDRTLQLGGDFVRQYQTHWPAM